MTADELQADRINTPVMNIIESRRILDFTVIPSYYRKENALVLMRVLSLDHRYLKGLLENRMLKGAHHDSNACVL